MCPDMHGNPSASQYILSVSERPVETVFPFSQFHLFPTVVVIALSSLLFLVMALKF